MKSFKKEIGEKIVSARLTNGLTQNALAKQIGVSQQVLSGYERGIASISLETFKDICVTLNAPFAWFLPDLKQYGDIVSVDDLELLREIKRIGDPKLLLSFLKGHFTQSNETKSHCKAKANDGRSLR